MRKLMRAVDRGFVKDEPHWTFGDVMLIFCATGVAIMLIVGIFHGHIN